MRRVMDLMNTLAHASPSDMLKRSLCHNRPPGGDAEGMNAKCRRCLGPEVDVAPENR